MYGAKANGIADVAFAVWAPGKVPSAKTRAAVVTAVNEVYRAGSAATPADAAAVKDFPDLLAHGEFVNLVKVLAAGTFHG